MSDDFAELIFLFLLRVVATFLVISLIYKALQNPESTFQFLQRRYIGNVLFWTHMVSGVIQFDPVLFLVRVRDNLVISLIIVWVELIAFLTPFLDPTLKVISSAAHCLFAVVFLLSLLVLTLVRNLALVFLILLQAALAECI
jgi:hypothetical protein